MYNNQVFLKKHTALTISRKDVDTSFILFPVRLETRFVNSHDVEDISEPDRALYAFKAMWDYVEALRNKSPESQVLSLARILMEKVENLDTVYREDRARLKNLSIKIIYATSPKDDLKKYWDRILEHIDRLATLDVVSDNEATEFLRKLDFVDRTIKRMRYKPDYVGKKRQDWNSHYSTTASYSRARDHMADCLPILEQMLPEDPKKSIVNRFSYITEKQFSKFKRVISFFDIDYAEINTFYRNLEINNIDVNSKVYKSTVESILSGLDDDFKDYELYVARFNGGKISRKNEVTGKKEEIEIKSRKQSLIDKMRSKIGLYDRYTLFAEKMILWSLRKATTGKDIATDSRVVRWRIMAKNTIFSFHEEREWLLSALKVYNDFKAEKNPNQMISATRLNANNKFIRNRKLSYKKKMKCLLVRMYPDEIAVTQMMKPLSKDEITHARTFWVNYFSSSSDLEREASWKALCSLYTPYRAAYIARSQFPNALDALKRDITVYGKGILNQSLTKYFPNLDGVEDDEKDIFQAPMSELMPDRFVLQASLYNGAKKEQNIVQYGRLIPKSIQVGLDLGHEPDMDSSAESVKFEGNLRWMTDYDEAEKMGMAITIPLDPYKLYHYTEKEKKEAKLKGKKLEPKLRTNFIFSSIYVMGIKELSVKNAEDSDLCSALIQKLLNAHLYSEEGLELLKLGTPTNILEDEDSYDTGIDAQIDDYYKKSILPLEKYVQKPSHYGDADLLSRLFCFNQRKIRYKQNPFLNTSGRDNLEIRKSVQVRKQFLENMKDTPILDLLKNNEKLKNYFTFSVSPEGVFPPFRVGNQPYGIVPVCDFKNLKFPKGDPLYIVRQILLYLTEKWNTMAKNQVISEENMYTKGKTEERYLNAMSATPISSSFYSRTMLKEPDVLFPDYFKGKQYGQTPIDNLYNIIATLYPSMTKKQFVENFFPGYGDIAISDESHAVLLEKSPWDSIRNSIKGKVSDLKLTDKELDDLITGTFDLFNYRLDAWLTGLLHKRLHDRIDISKTHKIAIGAYGWVFNLKEKNTTVKTDEYVVAPSINHAITAAVLRSSFTRTAENSRQDYSMSINLSSARVRQALRIIDGINNGLSLGAVLGSDMERMLHEDYKKKGGQEMDYFIYFLRNAYPLNVSGTDSSNFGSNKEKGFRDTAISVLNGVALLDDMRQRAVLKNIKDSQKIQLAELYGSNSKYGLLEPWLCDLFVQKDISGVNGLLGDNAKEKISRLVYLAQQLEDAYDALADVVTSESVYKLTQGNRVAVDALMNSLQSGRNIPSPEVTEIPLDSAHIEQRVFVALDDFAGDEKSATPMQLAEPSLDKWLGEILGFDSIVYQNVVEGIPSNFLLKDLGVSPSELVYLSGDWDRFRHFLKMRSLYASEIDVSSDMILLDEAMMAVDSLREMLSHSRTLRQDDLIATAVPANEGAYLKSDLKNRYERTKNKISSLVRGLLAVAVKVENHFTDNPAYPLDDDLLTDAVSLLSESFSCGVLDSLSGVDVSIFLDGFDRFAYPTEFAEYLARQKDLVGKLREVAAILDERIIKADKAKNGSKGNEGLYADGMKELLISSLVMIEHFTLQGNTEIKAAALKKQLDDRNFFSNASSEVMEDNLIGIADVRTQMAALHQVRMYGKWNFIDAARDIAPMQIEPDAPKDNSWLGAEVTSEDSVRDANVYTVINPKALIREKNGRYGVAGGLMIDFWVERIPYRRQTAAVSFAYDQPDAEPPQAILVGVSTLEGNHRWSEKRMLRTIRSAMHQVKTRAVEPEHVSADKWASGLFPIIDINTEGQSK